MKQSPHALMCGPKLSLWWTGVLLVSLLAGCPKPPEEVVCEPTAIFEVPAPAQGAGTAPFSVERLGAQMKGALDEPTSITFTSGNRALITWESYGHMYSESDVVYLRSEGLLRSVKFPENVHPLKWSFDGKTDRLRFGYYSKVCRQPDARGGYSFCKYSEERVPLVADMTCRRMPVEPRR